MEAIDTFQSGLAQRSRLENFLALEDVVSQAVQQGVVNPLPEAKSQVITNAYIKTRLRTVRSRLVWLGYLDEKEEPQRGRLYIGNSARRAIRQFQAEAGLTVDGWVGPETWTALEELVSFEHPLKAAEWLAKPAEHQQALWRAVRLRLSVLGLPKLPKPCLSRATAAPGLARFAGVAARLRLVRADASEQDVPGMVALLFDQDALVKRLGAYPGAFPFEDTDAGRQAQRFVTCVGRIELWLLGADIRLGENSNPECSLEDLHPRKALDDFWKMNTLDEASTRRRTREKMTASFFATLYKATISAPEAEQEPEFGDWLYAQLSTDAPSLRERFWNAIRELGSRMWDGIRRVWNWVKDRFRQFAKKLEAWAENLARLAHHLALKAIEGVREGIERLTKAVQFGKPGILPGSNPPDFFIHASHDLDYTVFLSQPEQAAQVQALAREMRQHAQDFGAAVQILSALLAALAATVIPGGGWIVFLVALARCVSQIKQAARAFA